MNSEKDIGKRRDGREDVKREGREGQIQGILRQDIEGGRQTYDQEGTGES